MSGRTLIRIGGSGGATLKTAGSIPLNQPGSDLYGLSEQAIRKLFASVGSGDFHGLNAAAIYSMVNVLSGSLVPQGGWNADTNLPDISGATTIGHYWIVSVDGATDLGGLTDWKVNDWAIKSADGWVKIDNTANVLSVAGRTGVVVLTRSDVGLGNVDNTADADKPISSATQDALDLKLNAAAVPLGIKNWKAAVDGETVVNGMGYLIDASAGAIGLNLAVPGTAYSFQFAYRIVNADNAITFNTNGAKWEGQTLVDDTLDLDIVDVSGQPVYTGTTRGWTETDMS